MSVKTGLWSSATPACELRLESYQELDEQNGQREVVTLSGDLQLGEKVYSFLSHPRYRPREAVRVQPDGARLEADVRFGPRNFVTGPFGSLSLDFEPNNRATLHLDGPNGLNQTVALRWKQKEFRPITVELDKLRSASFPQKITWKQVKQDLARVLRAAGFKPTIRRSNRVMADDPGGWTVGELHNALTTYRRPDRTPWYVHVFLASRFEEEDAEDSGGETLGIMFDTDAIDGNANAIPREGCAVFVDAHRSVYASEGPEAVDREILMTLVHEIGHTFNLLHSFESDKGRPDSPSIMNYPDEYDYGYQQYYDDFDFTFDRPELIHLHHHSAIVTEPGRADGQEWGRDIFKKAPRRPPRSLRTAREVSRYVSGFEKTLRKVNKEVDQDLKIEIALPRTSVLRSEPLVAAVTISNASSEGFTLRATLDWTASDLRLQLRKQGDSTYRALQPPLRRCVHRKPKTLAPRQSVTVQLPLMLTREGDPLSTPGVYQVRAALQIRRQKKWAELLSKPAIVSVKAPTNAEQRRLVRLYRAPDLKAYLLLPGGNLDPAARDAAARLHETIPDQPAGKLATLALAREATTRDAPARPIPAPFRDPGYVKRAVAAVVSSTTGNAADDRGLAVLARRTQRLLQRREEQLKQVDRRASAASQGILERLGRARQSTRQRKTRVTRS